MKYGQFCPIAKAAEVLGDKWSLLIVRELLMGGNRFNILQRGLGNISPTILTKRLNELADEGIVLKKKIPGQKGYEYFLTECGQELFPILEQLGVWGMRWARGGMPDEDLDAELLLVHLERSIIPEKVVGNESVVKFHFTDLHEYKNWWLIVKHGVVDTCLHDPGRDVDVYITTDLRTMIALWMGDRSYKSAIDEGDFTVVGPKSMTRNVRDWIKGSVFEGIPPAAEIRPA